MKNKKILISVIIMIIIIVLVAIGVGIFFITRNQESESESGSDNVSIVEQENGIKTVNIKSTDANPIEMDGIESTNIDIIDNFGELEVTVTLKNNTSETLNGFFIEMDLLDANGNTVSTIAQNSQEKIEPNQELTIMNNVTGLEGEINITNAKIVSIEKNTIQENIENSFNEMEEEANP